MRSKRRGVILVLFLTFISLLSACSYLTDFVVINDSAEVVEVRYKVKNIPGPFAPPVAPATIAPSELSAHGNQQWKKLTPAQYQLDQENRTVMVRLNPHEALLVVSMHNYSGHEDPWDAKEFPIEEIDIGGANGELKLVGQQARITFSEVSRALYTFTYK